MLIGKPDAPCALPPPAESEVLGVIEHLGPPLLKLVRAVPYDLVEELDALVEVVLASDV